jgi:hypothetical protein
MTEFASRPVPTSSALRLSLALLAVVAGLAVGKALVARSFVAPAAAEPAATVETTHKDMCRAVEVEIDEGYGVRGHVTRMVCRKAL